MTPAVVHLHTASVTFTQDCCSHTSHEGTYGMCMRSNIHAAVVVLVPCVCHVLAMHTSQVKGSSKHSSTLHPNLAHTPSVLINGGCPVHFTKVCTNNYKNNQYQQQLNTLLIPLSVYKYFMKPTVVHPWAGMGQQLLTATVPIGAHHWTR